MPNGLPLFTQPREITRATMETEVKIPWQTYARLGLVGTISIACLIACTWLLRLCVYLNQDYYTTRCYIGPFWSQFRVACWVATKWWPTFSKWWPAHFALIALWWAVPVALPTLYRFAVEQITKHLPPVAQPWDAQQGIWHPWVAGQRAYVRDLEAELDELLEAAERPTEAPIVIGERTEAGIPIPAKGRRVLSTFFRQVQNGVCNLSRSAAEKGDMTRGEARALMDFLENNPAHGMRYATRNPQGHLEPTALGWDLIRAEVERAYNGAASPAP